MINYYTAFAPELFSILGALLGFYAAKIASAAYSDNVKYPFYRWPDKSSTPAIMYSVIIGLFVSWLNVDIFIDEGNWMFYARRDIVMSFVIAGLFFTTIILKYAYQCTVMTSEEKSSEIKRLNGQISELKPKSPGRG